MGFNKGLFGEHYDFADWDFKGVLDTRTKNRYDYNDIDTLQKISMLVESSNLTIEDLNDSTIEINDDGVVIDHDGEFHVI